MECISGSIERITFQSDENGYCIAYLHSPDKTDLICIVGTMPGLQPGESIRCWGNWKKHLIYGNQFEVETFKTEIPADINGIKKYLGSGLIKGIRESYAQKIVDAFGISTFDILDSQSHRLKEVKGIGKKRIESIVSSWTLQKSIRDIIIFLQGHGVSNSYAQKIYKTYGNQSIQKLQENPYALARDIFGIGFKTADHIAQQLGMPHQASQRVDAGIEYVLFELANEGHVCYPLEEFLSKASEMLVVEVTLIQERANALSTEERIIILPLTVGVERKPHIWLKGLFTAEVGIAREIARIHSTPSYLRKVDVEKALTWVQQQLSLQLAQHQSQAVANSLVEKIQIITGGPGTGKSTITRAILTIMLQLTPRIILAAPTGKAAKRLSEITGRQAQTIHSLLEWDFKEHGFKRNRNNPLEADLIIIDEASMIDTSLMYNLLKAVPSSARLILVGDINQLPSVGPGNVLKDIINSRIISVTSLTEIFRQSANSRIVLNAHRINVGKMPDFTQTSESDFFFIEAETPEDVLLKIITLVTERLPRKYSYHPLHDIQVLSPMRKGLFGIDNLNQELQKTLNPKGDTLIRMGRSFKKGDKVMQIRNNYKKMVFNGDVGFITLINLSNQELTVDYDDKTVVYEFNELDELVLGYAISVHKYQGNEGRCILVPIHTSHYKMLDRNIVYTALTRGKELVIIIGNKKAMFIAVNNDKAHRRFTGLKNALEGTLIRLPL